MRKKYKKWLWLLVIPLVLVPIWFFWSTIESVLFGGEMLQMKCYNLEGQSISCEKENRFSVVGETEGVYSTSYDVNVRNTGSIPYTVSIVSASPTQLSVSLPTGSKTISPGETATWVGSTIGTKQFEGTTQTFSVTVEASFVCPEGKTCVDSKGNKVTAGNIGTITKSASKTVTISADPEVTVGLDIDLVGEGGTTETGETVTTVPSQDTSPITYTEWCSGGLKYLDVYPYDGITTCPSTFAGFTITNCGTYQDYVRFLYTTSIC